RIELLALGELGASSRRVAGFHQRAALAEEALGLARARVPRVSRVLGVGQAAHQEESECPSEHGAERGHQKRRSKRLAVADGAAFGADGRSARAWPDDAGTGEPVTADAAGAGSLVSPGPGVALEVALATSETAATASDGSGGAAFACPSSETAAGGG